MAYLEGDTLLPVDSPVTLSSLNKDDFGDSENVI